MSGPGTDPKAQSSSWIGKEPNYKRPGEQGVDYDEYGAEMDANARVWGVYVKETDKADEELFKGWNSAMDVMLGQYMLRSLHKRGAHELRNAIPVFAALFSAILTAFVLESSKDLKPDYSEVSALALIIISKGPPTPGTAPSENGIDALEADISNFVPKRSAVVVNFLWFLSLILSISVTLISMLAKEWCYFFMGGRTGAKFTQGRQRQKRWDRIRSGKMEEIILMLPLLMYIALLLFAIGLSVYLWNINRAIALPVIITTALTCLYYITTVFLSFLCKHSPYKTSIHKLLCLLSGAVFKNKYLGPLFRFLVVKAARLFLRILDFVKLDVHSEARRSGFRVGLRKRLNMLEKKMEDIRKGFLTSVAKSHKNETRMDEATSAMLLWMITNCEDPKSVDIALQALAGADSWLPCELLLRHKVDFQILQKLQRCLYILESPHLRSHKYTTPWNEQLDSAYLYSRALATLTRSAPKMMESPCVAEKERDDCMRRMQQIMSGAMNSSDLPWATPSSEYGFGTLLLEGSLTMSESSNNDFSIKQAEEQWNLLEQITKNDIQGVPPSATSVRALVSVIARTLLCTRPPSTTRSPLALVRLFNEYNFTPENEDPALEHVIGTALTIARLVDQRYLSNPGEETLKPQSSPGDPQARRLRLQHAREAYSELAMEQPTKCRTRELLTFGLIGLLDCPTSAPCYGPEDAESINTALQTLEILGLESHKLTLVQEGQNSGYFGGHSLASDHETHSWLDLGAQFKFIVEKWLKLWKAGNSDEESEVVARHLHRLTEQIPSQWRQGQRFPISAIGDQTEQLSKQPSSSFFPMDELKVEKLCIQGITHSMTEWRDCGGNQKQKLKANINKLRNSEAFCRTMLHWVKLKNGVSPYAMRFLWAFRSEIINSELSMVTTEDRTRSKSGERAAEEGAIVGPGQAGVLCHLALALKGGSPTCVRSSNYESAWFKLLLELCITNRQDVIDSGILDELTKECKDKCYRQERHRPRQDEVGLLGIREDKKDNIDMTWLDVYKILKERYGNPDSVTYGPSECKWKASGNEKAKVFARLA